MYYKIKKSVTDAKFEGIGISTPKTIRLIRSA
jgi:hypothetical protein